MLPEAHEALLASIREHLAPDDVEPGYTPEQIDQAEAILQFRLPPLVRALHTRFSIESLYMMPSAGRFLPLFAPPPCVLAPGW
jgi:hypothetical protein